MPIDINRIRLISITEEDRRGKRHRVVKMGYFVDSDPEPMAVYKWWMPEAYDDAQIVRLARSYFQGLSAGLAEATADWKLNPEEIARIRGDETP